jgi:hypothetical protein
MAFFAAGAAAAGSLNSGMFLMNWSGVAANLPLQPFQQKPIVCPL